MRAEVVGDDDVAGLQRRHENLFDVSEEARPVDRAVKDPRCGQARDSQRREKRTCLPPRVRGVVVDARASEGAPVPPEEIIGDAGFVEKNEVGRIPGRCPSVPRVARGGDVRPIVFGRPYRFF